MAEGPQQEPQDDAARARDAARLRELEERLAQKLRVEEGPSALAKFDQAHVAWRMVIEIVAGIGLGFGIGFGLDRLFGTMPIMLILFVLLGLVAGIKVMMRTAAELNTPAASGTEQNPAPAAARDDKERD